MFFESYRNYKRTKRHIRVALDNEYEKSVCHDIDKAAECDIRLFCKLVKRQKKRTSNTYPEIHDGNGIIYNDPSGVAEATYYESIIIPSPTMILTMMKFSDECRN